MKFVCPICGEVMFLEEVEFHLPICQSFKEYLERKGVKFEKI